ncbi:MAG TPA: serine protease [Thermoanaerobaculia bacterium]|jgi:S1-C subfamily serine protease
MAVFDELSALIEQSCSVFDRNGAAQLTARLAADIRAGRMVYPAASAKKTLAVLRRKRYFDSVLELAEAVMESGQTADEVRIPYAQALIDSGLLTAALPFLQQVVDSTTAASKGNGEARGLVGRVWKQLYVNGGGEDHVREQRLLRSFNAYYEAFAESPDRYWHGINAVAVQARAARDGHALRKMDAVAEEIYALTSQAGAADPWAMATAAEAALALGRTKVAIQRYADYAQSPEADAFEIFSTLRQLTEVWQLTNEKEPGATILPLLRSALLQRSGGDVSLSTAGLRHDLERVKTLEKTFGSTTVRSLRWYRTGLECCNPVCRINDSLGAGFGTGFVVRGRDFNDALGDELLVLTNAHVLSETYPGALQEGDGRAVFEATGDPTEYVLEKIVWSDDQLDATLARTDKPLPPCVTFEIAKRMPANDGRQRVYVIGHPSGGGLSISLNDNVLLDYDDRVAHYRAPTEGGSSGSPVFNAEWKLVALHHAGDVNKGKLNGKSGTYEANEGIRLSEIIAATKKAPIGAAPGTP